MGNDPKITEETARQVVELKDRAQPLDVDMKPFASLLNNEADVRRAFEAIENAIWRSVALDIQRDPFGSLAASGMTHREMKRRFKICEAWIRHARGDLGFSLEKTLDLIGHALRSELDGTVFDPAKLQTRIWTPT